MRLERPSKKIRFKSWEQRKEPKKLKTRLTFCLNDSMTAFPTQIPSLPLVAYNKEHPQIVTRQDKRFFSNGDVGEEENCKKTSLISILFLLQKKGNSIPVRQWPQLSFLRLVMALPWESYFKEIRSKNKSVCENAGQENSGVACSYSSAPGACCPKLQKLFGRISRDIILFVSSKRGRLEARNFVVVIIFIPFSICEKTSFTE